MRAGGSTAKQPRAEMKSNRDELFADPKERWRERRKSNESLATKPMVLFERKQQQLVVQPLVGKVNGAQFSLNFW